MLNSARQPLIRGRRRGNPDTRAEILTAARTEFTERGYDRATIRAIAQRAAVDPALVLHYFGSKEELFAACLDVPLSPATVIRLVFESGADSIGTALVTAILAAWDTQGNTNQLVAVLRSATGEGPVHDLVREFAHTSILSALVAQLDTDDAERRAGLIASQLIGLLVGRYLLELEPLVSAPVDELAAQVGPVIDRYAFDTLSPVVDSP
jgi:AcrR family transcriptional regulator